jgi:hypothetical protein
MIQAKSLKGVCYDIRYDIRPSGFHYVISHPDATPFRN